MYLLVHLLLFLLSYKVCENFSVLIIFESPMPQISRGTYWYGCMRTQSCPTLCNPMDYSPPGSSVHGIFQTGKLEWVAIFYSRASSWPRNRTRVSRVFIAGGFFTTVPPGKAHTGTHGIFVEWKWRGEISAIAGSLKSVMGAQKREGFSSLIALTLYQVIASWGCHKD